MNNLVSRHVEEQPSSLLSYATTAGSCSRLGSDNYRENAIRIGKKKRTRFFWNSLKDRTYFLKAVSKNQEFFTWKKNRKDFFQMWVLNAMQARFFKLEHPSKRYSIIMAKHRCRTRTRTNTNPYDTKTNAAGWSVHACVACESTRKKIDACLVCSLCLSGYMGGFSEDLGCLVFFVWRSPSRVE